MMMRKLADFLGGRTLRRGRYGSSGAKGTDDDLMQVRINVTLPDAEAGGTWAEEDQQPFRATEVRRIQRQRACTVPLNAAALMLCALFVLFGAAVVSRAARRAEISKSISAMESSIEATRRDNSELSLAVAAARDYSHVSTMAEKELNMVKADLVQPVEIYAPETRPRQQAQTPLAGSSEPYDARDGIISGSR